MNTSLNIEKLEKTFSTSRGRVVVLKEISLSINPGEFFVLLGPSGCGKSTLLNIIAGLEQQSAGRIAFGDKVISDLAGKVFTSPSQRGIAMVFQSYALYPHMSVARNIAFPLQNAKPRPSRQEISRRVEQTAEFLEIKSLLERKPAELSGGQRQRVAIGRAIIRKPSVFLMDEPLSNLDAQLRTTMRAQLKQLQKEIGITTVYVTHDQVEAMTLADRMAILHDGYLQQVGAPAEIYDHPANPFVGRFIGSPPMNVLDGRLARETQRTLFVDTTNRIRIPLPSGTSPPVPEDHACSLGIRPEHLELTETGAGDIEAKVKVVENLGAEYIIHAACGDKTLVARSQASPQQEAVGLKLDREKVRIFAG
ncbi:MAG: ATP-binding cassette domain-containing protein [Chitinivibrionales bacterium]|nr:ATP-binding cassette domain-containing protein [Chitinivibrionales bacterium]